ncbi:MAG: flagellin, partial [Bdellovibrionota bacterium]
AAEVLPTDPGAPGDYAVSTSDYRLPPVKIAGMPDPIEMVGHRFESAEMASSSVLQASAVSVLAQANQQPQAALRLLS